MKVDEYYVGWQTRHARFVNPKSASITVPWRGTTICQIYKYDNDTKVVIAEARATNHVMDNFDKNIGRKVSMTKALSKTDFDKPTRQQFWESYRVLPKEPRWVTTMGVYEEAPSSI